MTGVMGACRRMREETCERGSTGMNIWHAILGSYNFFWIPYTKTVRVIHWQHIISLINIIDTCFLARNVSPSSHISPCASFDMFSQRRWMMFHNIIIYWGKFTPNYPNLWNSPGRESKFCGLMQVCYVCFCVCAGMSSLVEDIKIVLGSGAGFLNHITI